MSFVRTVLGDIDPAALGPTYAHEHIVIDPSPIVELSADFLLADVDRAVQELVAARMAGLGAVVDAMPGGAGRNAHKLAQVAHRSGVHVVAATGSHLARYHPAGDPSLSDPVEALAERFVTEIETGIDDGEPVGAGPAPIRAGVIKVAAGADGLSDRERRVYAAAAEAQRRTGAPILAHCTDGRGAQAQVAFLADHGAQLAHVILSHTDKVVDRGYHGELLTTGVREELDQAFRWPPGVENGTLALLAWLLEDGYGAQVMLGMDAARQGYWTAYGGTPGMTFLLGEFSAAMAGRGIGPEAQRAILVANPAAAFAFASPREARS